MDEIFDGMVHKEKQYNEDDFVMNLLEKIPQQQRDVLMDYYISTYSLEKIGEKIGVTKEWARRIKLNGLKTLKKLVEFART